MATTSPFMTTAEEPASTDENESLRIATVRSILLESEFLLALAAPRPSLIPFFPPWSLVYKNNNSNKNKPCDDFNFSHDHGVIIHKLWSLVIIELSFGLFLAMRSNQLRSSSIAESVL